MRRHLAICHEREIYFLVGIEATTTLSIPLLNKVFLGDIAWDSLFTSSTNIGSKSCSDEVVRTLTISNRPGPIDLIETMFALHIEDRGIIEMLFDVEVLGDALKNCSAFIAAPLVLRMQVIAVQRSELAGVESRQISQELFLAPGLCTDSRHRCLCRHMRDSSFLVVLVGQLTQCANDGVANLGAGNLAIQP
ncbi:MAG: hypothetical protein EOQ44_25190 [Mesorhizobium sp.]|uniref:hypothetical protein n=1 Tax=Mesorhizobium sp. TaxID=1871066 RepID=UPI000FE68509|nr:hypothetical protein [Mesorhizobium sp.]RWB40441.1 MAG: hypothetical protein EOQ44_25190 [Mesorhizobium sp.]